jgi:Phosphopantetheine attachment site.
MKNMSKDEILINLSSIINEVIDASFTFSGADKIADIDGLDSIAMIQILSSIKSKFGVSLAVSEIVSLKTLNDLVDCIAFSLGEK